MKYYICELMSVLSGEFEVSTAIRYETDGDPLEYANKIASTFWGYGVEDHEEDGVYHFPSYIICFVDFTKEVPKDVYDALTGIITKLEVNV